MASPRLARLLHLVLVALPLALGLAASAGHAVPVAPPPLGVRAVSAPHQSLPVPVHNEATCAFCQAAIFPPCAPQPTDISLGEQGLVSFQRPVPDARVPHATTSRPPSTRAPPPLRDV